VQQRASEKCQEKKSQRKVPREKEPAKSAKRKRASEKCQEKKSQRKVPREKEPKNSNRALKIVKEPKQSRDIN